METSKHLIVLKALELGHTFTFKDGPKMYRSPHYERFHVVVEVDQGNWLISVNDFIRACEDIPDSVIDELEEAIFLSTSDDITLDNKIRT